tara:strand:+ start:585 stop:734 length:150 start_codon:yes stop_codon:yes gene_type:complete
MTPMASAIANAYEDQLFLRSGLSKSFIAPGQPVHWIVGVLQEIGARRFG